MDHGPLLHAEHFKFIFFLFCFLKLDGAFRFCTGKLKIGKKNTPQNNDNMDVIKILLPDKSEREFITTFYYFAREILI